VVTARTKTRKRVKKTGRGRARTVRRRGGARARMDVRMMMMVGRLSLLDGGADAGR
jgi:hypothetical protein